MTNQTHLVTAPQGRHRADGEPEGATPSGKVAGWGPRPAPAPVVVSPAERCKAGHRVCTACSCCACCTSAECGCYGCSAPGCRCARPTWATWL